MTREDFVIWMDENGITVVAVLEANRTTRLITANDVTRSRAAVVDAYIMPYMAMVDDPETLTPSLMFEAVSRLTFAALLLDRLTVTRYATVQATHEASNTPDRSTVSDTVAIYRKRGMQALFTQLAEIGVDPASAQVRHILLDEL